MPTGTPRSTEKIGGGTPPPAPAGKARTHATAKKPTAKNTTLKKATSKKATSKKATVEKATAKRVTAEKTSADKTTAKKPTGDNARAKKPTAKNTTTKKATAEKATARRVTAEKATAKKATATKPTAKNTTATRATAVEATDKRATAGKPTGTTKRTGRKAAGTTAGATTRARTPAKATRAEVSKVTAAPGLGRAITIRRLELGLSRQVLATRANLSYPYVSEIERGAKAPSSASLYALAEALELTPGALLDRAESLARGDAPAGDAHRRVPQARAGRRESVALGGAADTAAALAEVVRTIVRDELYRQPVGRGRTQRPPSAAGGGEHAGTTSSGDRVPGAEARSTTEEEVRTEVLAATRLMLGNDTMAYDTEGDLPIRRGDVMLFIRVLDDPLSVLVFSPVLVGVTESMGLLERLNALNANMHFVRFCLTHGGVVVDLEVPADVFTPSLLEAACRAIAEAAENVGGDLQNDFGGRLFFGDEELTPTRRGTAGYL